MTSSLRGRMTTQLFHRSKAVAGPALRVLPGDEFNGSAVNLLKTAKDLFSPSFFRALIDHVILGQYLSQHLGCIPFHDSFYRRNGTL